ncbi:MAG: hypothetical protein RL120_09345, partial [Gammaproteobacteria bacterium]
LLGVILVLWYPGILFNVDGGWTGLRIVIGVDLVLGPLLTLVVFKSGKPGLRFDLTCIGTAQAICMAAGMWIVYQERPLALVLAHDTIYSLAKQEFTELGRDWTMLQDFPGPYPKLVYTELPDNYIAAEIAAIRSQFIGDPLYIQTERYRPLPQLEQELIGVFRREQAVRAEISDELAARLQANCLLSKFVSAVTSGYVCFDSTTRSLGSYYEFEYQREVPAAAADDNSAP